MNGLFHHLMKRYDRLIVIVQLIVFGIETAAIPEAKANQIAFHLKYFSKLICIWVKMGYRCFDLFAGINACPQHLQI
jgi:hypothetical protein